MWEIGLPVLGEQSPHCLIERKSELLVYYLSVCLSVFLAHENKTREKCSGHTVTVFNSLQFYKTISTMETCSCPGCDQPGRNKCSACKTTPYCGVKCQTDDWPHHKEECPGHLRKIGMASLQKAKGFHQQQNWLQALRHSDFALTKLKRLADRPIESISAALNMKYGALTYTGQNKEALECTREWYNLWAMARGPAHPHTIAAAFHLIQSLTLNNEFVDAELFARTLWEIFSRMLNDKGILHVEP